MFYNMHSSTLQLYLKKTPVQLSPVKFTRFVFNKQRFFFSASVLLNFLVNWASNVDNKHF